MNYYELRNIIVKILKEVDGSDIMSDNKYYEKQADQIISLCRDFYNYCELMEERRN